jgi:hypothetical protein
MIKRKTRQKLDAKYSEMNMNLENNYKDLAKTALKELDLLVEEMKSTGELNEKDYIKVRRDVDGYKTRLSDYHH